MEITLRPITVESDSGAEKLLWDWSVVTTSGKALSGIEAGFNAARFYILVACFRFLFTSFND